MAFVVNSVSGARRVAAGRRHGGAVAVAPQQAGERRRVLDLARWRPGQAQ